MTLHPALSTRVLLQPLRAGLAAGADNRLLVLVRVQAPEAPAAAAAARPPQALALVIDKSGSMAGRPLAEARRCAGMVIDRLRPDDRVSLVEFDDKVRRLWPAVPRGDGHALRAAVEAIQDGGATNLHGGWLEGADTLADVPGSGLRRVILLSDGCANKGLEDPAAIAAQCADWAARGIGTSTYGLGESFNEDLMVRMARAGGGSSYYGDTAEDLLEPFERELDLIGNLCLRDLRLVPRAPDGIACEVLNDLPSSGNGWRLADLAWGAEAWAVLRLDVPAQAVRSAGDLARVLQVQIVAIDAEGAPVELERAGLALPVMPAAEQVRLPADALVAQRAAEVDASAVLRRMRGAAGRHDWDEVERLLADAQQRFAGNGWLASMLDAMKAIAARRELARLRKEAMYSSESINRRLSARDETVSFSIDAEATDKPSYLRRKPAQGRGRP